MQSIFGTKEQLFHWRNGIVMSKNAEERFDRGFIAIVPELDSDATSEDIRAW